MVRFQIHFERAKKICQRIGRAAGKEASVKPMRPASEPGHPVSQTGISQVGAVSLETHTGTPVPRVEAFQPDTHVRHD